MASYPLTPTLFQTKTFLKIWTFPGSKSSPYLVFLGRKGEWQPIPLPIYFFNGLKIWTFADTRWSRSTRGRTTRVTIRPGAGWSWTSRATARTCSTEKPSSSSRSPQTVFGLEEARSKLIPGIIIFLQKVLALFLSFFLSKCYSKDESSWLKYYNYKHYYLNLWKLKYQIKTPS